MLREGSVRRAIGTTVAVGVAAAMLAGEARAQALPRQVQALYPAEVGELVYVDVRALQATPHYSQIKAQVLPEKFRQLEQFSAMLGIRFDSEIQQLSWAMVGSPEAKAIGFMGVAEGQFTPAEAERQALQLKLDVARHAGATVLMLGRNDQEQEFVFAFPDAGTAVFGFRPWVEQALERRAQGGASLLNNTAMREMVDQLNGRVPLWLALDEKFAALGLKQMLPGAASLPGFDRLAASLRGATLAFELTGGLRGAAGVRCANASDALLFSTLVQAALTYQTWQMRETNADLARVLGEMQVNRNDTRLDLALAIREPDFVALLQKNSFALKF